MGECLLTLKWDEAGKSKTWVAQILGRSRTYGLDREFVAAVWRRSARAIDQRGEADYPVGPGLYEVCELGTRSFVVVAGDPPAARPAAREEALEISGRLEEARTKEREKVSGEVDDALARFDGEGGFRIGASDN